MRKDVKVGLVLSLFVVVVAGLYYVGRDKQADPLKLDDASAQADKSTAAKGPVANAQDPRSKPNPNRATAPGNRPVAPQTNPRVTPKPPASGTLTPPSDPTANPPPKSEPVVALNPNPDLTGSAAPAPKEPVANATPVKDTFDNMFKFDKDADKSAAADPAGKSADTSTPSVRPQAGTDTAQRAPANAPAKAAPPPAPPVTKGSETFAGDVRTHKVERGDSYSLLAEQYYGSQRFAQFLMEANPQYGDPMKLREGITLRIPPRPSDVPVAKLTSAPSPPAEPKAGPAATPTPAPSSAAQRTYVVKDDDTLYAIASRELGKGTRWTEILDLNKDILKGSPERLRVGQSLKLPGAAKSDPAPKTVSPKKP